MTGLFLDVVFTRRGGMNAVDCMAGLPFGNLRLRNVHVPRKSAIGIFR